MDLRKARELAIGIAPGPGTEEVRLESALRRVLASDVTALGDLPGEYRSRLDGFALRSGDTAAASPERPVILDIAPGLIAAGSRAAAESAPGRCNRIMTGAVVPPGADVVIPFEDAAADDERLIVTKPLRPPRGVIPPGADAAAGDPILTKGDVLTPSRLALAAATGIGRVTVFKRPRVAILSTGDELRETGQDPAGPAIFCNNIHLLEGLVRVGGSEPVHLGIAPDDPDVIFSMLENLRADLVVTTGGMGRGSRDFVLEVWRRLGVTVHFDSLNISPGKGSALGSIGERIFLGLPGNPWAARIVFEEIASPVIGKLRGTPNLKTSLDARASVAIENRKSLYQAVYGSLKFSAGSIFFLPIEAFPGSALLPLLRNCPAYTILPPGQSVVREGETIEVKVPDLSLDAWASLTG